MAPFDRPYATFYWSAIVNIALSCTIFELVLRSSGVRLANHSHCQVWYGIVEFNVTLDTLYHFGYHFTGQMTQTTLLHTERQWLVNHVKHQSHQAQLTERDREGCKQKLFYIQHHEDRRHRSACKIELNQARSKPDTVNRPVRTARIFVHHYNSTQYCNIETVLFLLHSSSRPTSFLQTNITSQMWISGGNGGSDCHDQGCRVVEDWRSRLRICKHFITHKKLIAFTSSVRQCAVLNPSASVNITPVDCLARQCEQDPSGLSRPPV